MFSELINLLEYDWNFHLKISWWGLNYWVGLLEVEASTTHFKSRISPTVCFSSFHFEPFNWCNECMHFYERVLMTFIEKFNEKADMLMARFRSMADGKTQINMLTEINHATLDTVRILSINLVLHCLRKTSNKYSNNKFLRSHM